MMVSVFPIHSCFRPYLTSLQSIHLHTTVLRPVSCLLNIVLLCLEWAIAGKQKSSCPKGQDIVLCQSVVQSSHKKAISPKHHILHFSNLYLKLFIMTKIVHSTYITSDWSCRMLCNHRTDAELLCYTAFSSMPCCSVFSIFF
jgi:hypothetical protein